MTHAESKQLTTEEAVIILRAVEANTGLKHSRSFWPFAVDFYYALCQNLEAL